MHEVGNAPNADNPLSEGSGRRGVRMGLSEALALARSRGVARKSSLKDNRDDLGHVSPIRASPGLADLLLNGARPADCYEKRASLASRSRRLFLNPCSLCDKAGLHAYTCPAYSDRRTVQPNAVVWP